MSAAPGAMSGVFANRYEVERVLGEGATATVYLARDRQSGVSVAIKMLRPELAGSGAAGRFAKEIRRTTTLSHPRILPVLASGDHDGQLYVVLPYMEGGTLRDRLRREKQLPLDEALAIMRPIAEALDYAHAQGLIHRDVKPENILFTNGEAVLGDFGIARALQTVLEETVTSTGIVRGTPAYMSPEQASGSKDLDGRSDQYALACVLYEMIAGVPAFMGPTPEAIIAQRFTHAPRDIRAYRPAVPTAVQPVFARVFAITPADRYRASSEFVAAFAEAMANPPAAVGPGRVAWRQPAVLTAATIVIVMTGWLVATLGTPGTAPPSAPLDTTRIAVLPLENTAPRNQRWRDDDLLQQALSRWRGITIVDPFQVADAVRRLGPVRSSRDAQRIAEALGAGRYIRGTLSQLGAEGRASLSLFDVKADAPLHHVAMPIPQSLDGAVSAFAALADSLLLRSAVPDSGLVGAGSRSLPAVQAFGKAQLALESWDLAAADSGFQAALANDPAYARASLWLAQVRSWRERPGTAWRALAERATASDGALNARERRLAEALVRLANGNYDGACSIYDGLRRRNDRDFAAWFGLGQCQSLNRLVVPDSHSPSGWRLQGNMYRAVQAYTRALEILPSVHRGYEGGAFDRLKRGMLLSPDVLAAYGAADSAVFYARPALIGDTLVMVPYPWTMLSAGGPRTIPPRYDDARRRLRAEFRRIAAGWSSAFPDSPGAKEAVAVSLDLLGDIGALDTLRRARALTADSARQVGLMAEEVLLLVKYGIARNPGLLQRAGALADSAISRALRSPSQESARALLPVAAVTGRCADADSLATRAATTEFGRIPPQLFALGYRVLIRTTLDCADEMASLTELALAIERQFSSAADRRLPDAMFLLRPMLLGRQPDARMVARLLGPDSNAYVRAAALVVRGKTAAARVVLDSIAVDATTPTIDMALAQARLWIALRDTSRAARRLDVNLATVAETDPMTWDEPGRAAALTAAIVLRADICRAQADTPGMRKWSAVAAALLEHAGAASPSRDRMISYSTVGR